MSKDLTPEEKLLKLIKNNPDTLKGSETDIFIDPSKIPPQVKRNLTKKHGPVNFLPFFTKMNWILIPFLSVILIYQYARIGIPLFPTSIRQTLTSENMFVPSTDIGAHENFDSYSKIFKEKNIFKSFGDPPPVAISSQKQTSFSDLMKNLSLTGIIDGDKPQAIIEDHSNGQMYYVNQGDYMGPTQVIDITGNQVRIKYGDEEGVLTL